MTLVIALNALLVVLVLGTIVGLHVWAILTSRPQQVAYVGTQATVRTRRQRRRSAAHRLAGAVAAR